MNRRDDDDVGGRLCGGVVTGGERPVEATVCALVAVDERGAVGQRGFHVGDCGQRFVLDLDRLERVGRGVAIAGHDDGDGVADVAHLVDRDRRVGRADHVGCDRPGAWQRAELLGEVGAAERGDDAGHVERR